MRSVCLIGAGNIARTHADVLADLPTAGAVAVCDTNADRARALAEEYAIPYVFGSLDDAITSETFDSAHVLLPPDLHAVTGRRLLTAGIGVLLEKPMALSADDCQELVVEAADRDLPLGVNHNAVFYRAYLELRAGILARSYGPLQHLLVVMNHSKLSFPPPAHFAAQHPRNLAFETAVHPFSQVYDLAGPLLSADTTLSGRRELAPGQPFYDTWLVSMVCERATAQVCVSYAGSYPTWHLTAICEDGILTAAIDHDRITALDGTRWGEQYEPLHIAVSLASQEARQGALNTARSVASALRGNQGSPWFTSMQASIAAFHGCRAPGQPRVDGNFARNVVAVCEEASSRIPAAVTGRVGLRGARRCERCDVLLTGGTGFIGRDVVQQLASAGATVRVMARNAARLPDPLYGDAIQLLRGDVSDPDAVSLAVRRARTVIHLATGDWLDFKRAATSIVGAADLMARACLREGVERLVFTGTIASLYLGDAHETITGSTATDARLRERGAYAWAKARSEEVLMRYFRQEGLPVCIIRPGIVLGAGGTPFHSGFGIWRGNVHCVGWNDGTNPLPLVLASDVGSALIAALSRHEAVGKTYNLVGDVRLCAREYVRELSVALERALVFHPMHPAQHQAFQLSKWALKSVLRRRLVPLPSYRSIKSMGCAAQFECTDVKTDLDWQPLVDRSEFIDRALRVHGRRTARRQSGRRGERHDDADVSVEA
ncbi:MAG: NAD-dependent epimerase/dehydratase family protein, partial [Solirubrobacterales bacterium]|nr:NAD-dependent epimerase/dehydratase family protein [Solirubrobacterales bacterium]